MYVLLMLYLLLDVTTQQASAAPGSSNKAAIIGAGNFYHDMEPLGYPYVYVFFGYRCYRCRSHCCWRGSLCGYETEEAGKKRR
jgi:hypothetical protein